MNIPTLLDILTKFDVDSALSVDKFRQLTYALETREEILRANAVRKAENDLIAKVAENLFPTKR